MSRCVAFPAGSGCWGSCCWAAVWPPVWAVPVWGWMCPTCGPFVPCVAGIVLVVGGWPLFRWAGPAVLFLIFMFPLPWSWEKAVLSPLQSLATQASTYALQTLGIAAHNEGNRICIEDLNLGVVDDLQRAADDDDLSGPLGGDRAGGPSPLVGKPVDFAQRHPHRSDGQRGAHHGDGVIARGGEPRVGRHRCFTIWPAG